MGFIDKIKMVMGISRSIPKKEVCNIEFSVGKNSPDNAPRKGPYAGTQPQRSSPTRVTAKSSSTVPMGDSWAHEVELSDLEQHRDRFIALDLETTGLSVKTGDRIIEIGAVLFENGQKAKEFNTLVNPMRPIPAAASRVNHIYDHDVRTAPKTSEALMMLKDFLGDAFDGKTLVVAHNAPFDFSFLMTAFSYCGHSADMNFADTLDLSRKFIKGLPDYKLNTVGKHFGIKNKDAHRATSDAEVCGRIFYELMGVTDLSLQERRASTRKGDTPVTDKEYEVCAFIQKMILDNGNSLKFLRFYKETSGYVGVLHPYKFLSFKIPKRGNGYVLVPSDSAEGVLMEKNPCTKTEGGDSYTRCVFSCLKDLLPLKEYILKAYEKSNTDLYNARTLTGYTDEKIEEKVLCNTISLPVTDMERFLSSFPEQGGNKA